MLKLVFLLLLVAAGQGVFTGFFLIIQNRLPAKTGLFLGCFFIAFSLQLIDFVLINSSQALIYPHLIFWSLPFNLAFGPLLFLYLKFYIHEEQPFKSKELVHFLPFLAYFGFLASTFYFESATSKVSIIKEITSNQAYSFPIFLYIQIAIYLTLSWKKLSRQEIPKDSSYWLKKFWLGTLVIALFGFLQNLLVSLRVPQQPVTGFVGASIAIFYIYYGAVALLKKQQVMLSLSKEKYHYSSLSNKGRSQVLHQIQNMMLKEKLYTNPELSLKLLASRTGLPERHISEVINDQLQTNFKDFLNHLRVEEFKKQLINPKNAHLSILGIALECGFSSKTTFNTAFRKSTGQTPSEYKKQLEK